MTDNEKIARFIGEYSSSITSSIMLREAVLFALQNKHRAYPDMTVSNMAFALEHLAHEATMASKWLREFKPKDTDTRRLCYRGHWALKESLLRAVLEEHLRVLEEESHDPREQLEKLAKKLSERCANQCEFEEVMSDIVPQIAALEEKAVRLREKGQLLEGETRFSVLRFLLGGWNYFRKIEHKFSVKDVEGLLKYAKNFCVGQRKYRPFIAANALRLIAPKEFEAVTKTGQTRPKA